MNAREETKSNHATSKRNFTRYLTAIWSSRQASHHRLQILILSLRKRTHQMDFKSHGKHHERNMHYCLFHVEFVSPVKRGRRKKRSTAVRRRRKEEEGGRRPVFLVVANAQHMYHVDRWTRRLHFNWLVWWGQRNNKMVLKTRFARNMMMSF